MKRDKKVVIATHGELASGFASALNIIIGDLDKVEIICGYTTPEFNLDESIQQIMKNHDFKKNDLIVCTDMMGGSMNNGFIPYLKQYPFHLVSNVNLAFLIDLILTPGDISEEILDGKTNDDFVMIKYVNQVMTHFNNDLDDSL